MNTIHFIPLMNSYGNSGPWTQQDTRMCMVISLAFILSTLFVWFITLIRLKFDIKTFIDEFWDIDNGFIHFMLSIITFTILGVWAIVALSTSIYTLLF